MPRRFPILAPEHPGLGAPSPRALPGCPRASSTKGSEVHARIAAHPPRG
ncbi:hypothetical protein L519_3373 [Bordetella bronchiseptica MBORD678]|nr:hypothetical protein AZ15_3572 [Bordetella bronchiseptica A1-7]KDB72682.1 hypothetical protein AZ21_3544 [Bordetella bronchiseptica B20-10725633]KDB75635.1 hypothetical protein L495_3467 [Bordetella bronchiseptica CARE970018BB]KDB92331.1 hypothetical protein AZ18_3563 [Bordetella bronchiseptica D993]KDC00268.1 hypothetical protein AZ23_3483 [Bordetella bronchiseptica E010]KDC07369.1 hypothetical protein AZ24_3390 [Bordetella bronchiseptica E013]KDC10721.1 hypothetical protein AZ19_3442 [Bo